MIDAEQAVQIAADFFSELFPEGTFTDLRLVEIDLDEPSGVWLVTMAYRVREEAPAPPETPGEPLLKRFRIDAASGRVQAVRPAGEP